MANSPPRATEPTGQPAAPPPKRSPDYSNPVYGVLVLLLLAAIGWGIWATWFQSTGGAEGSGPEVGVSVGDIADEPAEYLGSTVVVSGQIQRIAIPEEERGAGAAGAITPATTGVVGFTLGSRSGDVMVFGENLPELAGIEQGEQIIEGDIVQVTGTVRAVEFAQLRTDDVDFALNAGFDAGEFDDFDQNPVIVPTDVSLVPVVAQNQAEQVTVAAAALADNPAEYFGRRITVTGLPVASKIKDEPFEVFESDIDGDGGADIAVIGQPSALQDATLVTSGQVTGTVIEPSTAALASALNLSGGTDIESRIGLDQQAIADLAAVIVVKGGSSSSP